MRQTSTESTNVLFGLLGKVGVRESGKDQKSRRGGWKGWLVDSKVGPVGGLATAPGITPPVRD